MQDDTSVLRSEAEGGGLFISLGLDAEMVVFWGRFNPDDGPQSEQHCLSPQPSAPASSRPGSARRTPRACSSVGSMPASWLGPGPTRSNSRAL